MNVTIILTFVASMYQNVLDLKIIILVKCQLFGLFNVDSLVKLSR